MDLSTGAPAAQHAAQKLPTHARGTAKAIVAGAEQGPETRLQRVVVSVVARYAVDPVEHLECECPHFVRAVCPRANARFS